MENTLTAIVKIKSIIKKLVSVMRSGVWLLDGNEASTDLPLKVMFSGSAAQKNYFSGIIFRNNSNELYLGKLYIWHLYYLIKTNNNKCSLIIIEGSDLHKSIYVNKKDFYVPIWLKSTVNIPVKSNSSSKEDMRRIRKYQLNYKITNDSSDVSDFYHNMYLPTLTARHKETAIGIEYDEIQNRIKQGDGILLLITKSDETIAGTFIISGQLPRLWAGGVRDANPDYWKCGAFAATYVFASDYLSEQGYKKMHLGMTRSFLNDGILQYKKKFNNKIIDYDTNAFIIKPLNISDGLIGFLVNNPFVYLNENHLSSAVFKTNDKDYTSKELVKLQKKYNLNGLSGLNVFSFNNKKIIMTSHY